MSAAAVLGVGHGSYLFLLSGEVGELQPGSLLTSSSASGETMHCLYKVRSFVDEIISGVLKFSRSGNPNLKRQALINIMEKTKQQPQQNVGQEGA